MVGVGIEQRPDAMERRPQRAVGTPIEEGRTTSEVTAGIG